MSNKVVSKKIHLNKRIRGFFSKDDFECVGIMIPELEKEDEILVHDCILTIKLESIKRKFATISFSPISVNYAYLGSNIIY